MAKSAMKDLGERYNKHWKKNEDVFGHTDNDEIPFLLDEKGNSYMRGSSSNFLERMTGENQIWNKEPYVKAFKEMYNKLHNVPKGFTGLLDMYNSGFMDTGVPAQLLHPTIKPNSILSVSGTGKKAGNYDEIFTYDVPSITPKLTVVYDNNKNTPSKKTATTTDKKSTVAKTQEIGNQPTIKQELTKVAEKNSAPSSGIKLIDKSTGRPLPDFPVQFRANPTGGYTVYQNRNGKFTAIGTSKNNTGNVEVIPGYEKGGYVEPHGYNIDVPGPELMGKRHDYLMDANYESGGYINHGYNISIPGPQYMGKRKDYLMDGNYRKGGKVPKGYHVMPSGRLMSDAEHKPNGNVGKQDLERFMTGNVSIQGGQGAMYAETGGLVPGGMLVGDKQYYPYGGYVERNSEGGAPSYPSNRAEFLSYFGSAYPIKAYSGVTTPYALPAFTNFPSDPMLPNNSFLNTQGVGYNFTGIADKDSPYLQGVNPSNTAGNQAATTGSTQQPTSDPSKQTVQKNYLDSLPVNATEDTQSSTESAQGAYQKKQGKTTKEGMKNFESMMGLGAGAPGLDPASMAINAVGAAGDAITGGGAAIASMAGNEKAANALTKAGAIGKVAESIGNVVPIPGVGKAVGALASIFAAPFTAWGENIAEEEKKKSEDIYNFQVRNTPGIMGTRGLETKYGGNIKNMKQRVLDDIYNDFDRYMKK